MAGSGAEPATIRTMDGHSHRSTAAARSRGRLTATLALTCAFLIVEVAGALWSGSLALLADAGHMLTDAARPRRSRLFATWIAARPPTPAKTYGYYRAEILAALVNALVLLVVAGAILVETYRRLLTPPAILGRPDGGVASAGLGVNLVVRLAAPPRRRRQPERARGLPRGDERRAQLAGHGDRRGGRDRRPAGRSPIPLASGAIALLIVPRTWSLLKQAVNVLLEGTPPHLELGEIEDAMRARARACGASTTCTCGR